MVRIIVFITLISFSLKLNCQIAKISGLIKDSHSNLPVPYTYVYIKGSSHGTISNTDGCYVFFLPLIPAHDSIVVSCVGYSTRTFSLKNINDSIFNIGLEPSTVILQEVKVAPLNLKSLLKKTQQRRSEERRVG